MNVPTSVKVGGGLVLAGVLGFFGYKSYKKVKENKAINNFNKSTIEIGPTGQIIKRTKISVLNPANATASINLEEIAQKIGMALGTAYPFWDPRHATEDENAAAIAVLKVPKVMIPQLAKIYQDKYKSNLQQDLEKYLEERWDDVRTLFI
jgi:hypothetical protein